MRNHTVVVGYGTKGRSAVSALLADGVHPSQIVVVDTDTHSLDMAAGQGLVTVHGSATKADVLKLAGVTRARAVVVAPNMDDTAVLVTLSVREIAPSDDCGECARVGESAFAEAVGCRFSGYFLRDGGSNARVGHGHPVGGGDDGGFAFPRRGVLHCGTPGGG